MKFPLYFDVKIVHINVLPHLAHWNGRFTGWEIICWLLQNIYFENLHFLHQKHRGGVYYIWSKDLIISHPVNLPFQCAKCGKTFMWTILQFLHQNIDGISFVTVKPYQFHF